MATEPSEQIKTIRAKILLSWYFLFFAVLWHLIPDKGTVALLAATGLPWALPIFIEQLGIKELHLPGGVKMNFEAKINNATEKLANTPLLESQREGVSETMPLLDLLLQQDHNIAVVAARIEIERRLRKLAEENQIRYDRPVGIRVLIRDLSERNLLSPTEGAGLADILFVMNEAAHGARIDIHAANRALDIAKSIIHGLEMRQSQESSGN